MSAAGCLYHCMYDCVCSGRDSTISQELRMIQVAIGPLAKIKMFTGLGALGPVVCTYHIWKRGVDRFVIHGQHRPETSSELRKPDIPLDASPVSICVPCSLFSYLKTRSQNATMDHNTAQSNPERIHPQSDAILSPSCLGVYRPLIHSYTWL